MSAAAPDLDRIIMAVVARDLQAYAERVGDAGFGSVPAMAAALVGGLAGRGGIAPPPDRTLTAAQIAPTLLATGLAGRDTAIEVARSAVGFAKDTFLIDLVEPGDARRRLVVRRDLPAGPTRNTVADEYPLLEAVHRLGIPVPRPLLLETDPAVLAQPFMIVEGVSGRPDLPAWESRADMLRAVTRDHAEILARIHALSPDDLPVPAYAAGDLSDEIAAYIAHWEAIWRDCRPADSRAVDQGFERLKAAIPRGLGAKRFVHADYGFHNLLAEEGRVTAILDWEFAHLGEPAEDLGYCRQFVEPLGLWDEFLDAYAGAGGDPVATARMAFYQVWRGTRNAVCCALGRQGFESGRNTDLRLAYAGRVLYEGYVADMQRQLELLA